ncbi:MAG: SAM-dependent methyltransferase [Acidobacteriia bacterium]|nr:SAM-dependent methyltransferase [Terriglobia bacterium]
MHMSEPSRTALAAAAYRAAHQVLEQGRIFADPLALRILGEDAETVARKAEEQPSGRGLRIFIAARTRFTEDSLAASVERGVRQLVVLGAGLDTFAYRSPLRARLRIFEVDHPATQEWKRQRLGEAAIPIPDSLTFAPIDFEHQTLAGGLAAAGFDRAQQTFFSWLGVVPYLTEEAVMSTLAFIASLPNGAHVVFDYSDPPALLSGETLVRHEKRAAYVAELGEAWLSHFEADDLRTRLAAFGFSEIEDWGPPQIAARYYPDRMSTIPEKGGHILRAATIGRR